ncbi:MAG: hypothetical protein K2N54_08780, partial [Helicobacter sp.]|nr:hypothetical protein [Helicobacter sp.]
MRDTLVAQGAAPNKIRHINVYGYTTECESQFYTYDNRAILERLTNDTFEAKSFAKFIDLHVAQHERPAFCSFEFRRSLRHALYDDARELESRLIEHYKTQPDRFPTISVAYSLGRSGTTLMTQWLASLGIFCYPTNLLKPYFETPILGFKNAFAIMQTAQANIQSPYTSNFGDTEEMFDVIQYRIIREFNILQQANIDSVQTIAATYRGVMDIFQKPLIQKIQPFEIEFLEQCFNNTFYLVLSRDIYAHALAVVELYQRFWNTSGHLKFYKNYAPKNLDFTKESLVYAAATLKNALAHRDRVLQNVPESRKIH